MRWDGLATLRPSPLIAVLVGDIWVSEAAAGSLARLGATRAIPHLLARLRTSGGLTARACAQAMRALGDTVAIEEQRRDIVGGATISVRSRAAISIGCLGSPEGGDVELLVQALDDDQIVAQDAVKGLGLLGGDRAVGALLGVVSDDVRNSVRAAAARELRAWPTDAVVNALLRLLDSDGSQEVRTAAFLSLEQTGVPEPSRICAAPRTPLERYSRPGQCSGWRGIPARENRRPSLPLPPPDFGGGIPLSGGRA